MSDDNGQCPVCESCASIGFCARHADEITRLTAELQAAREARDNAISDADNDRSHLKATKARVAVLEEALRTSDEEVWKLWQYRPGGIGKCPERIQKIMRRHLATVSPSRGVKSTKPPTTDTGDGQ